MSIQFQKHADGVAVLTIDVQGRSANVLDATFAVAFGEALARIEADSEIKGVILTSGKRDFSVGADIGELRRLREPRQAFEKAQAFKAELRRLERVGRPVVAALNGSAFGAGLELALACHHRVLLDAPHVRVGLPEVKLGLLPGAGGTQRLPRLIGLQAAAPLLLEGNPLRAQEAHRLGVVHELAGSAEELMQKARAFIARGDKQQAPWDQAGFRWPGGDARAPAAAQMFAVAPSMVDARTYGNYPAPIYILACLFEGGLLDFDAASVVESRYFAACASSQAAQNLIESLWFQRGIVEKGRSRPEGVAPSQVHKLGVLGAGMMGAGIAHVAAGKGIQVVLLDVTLEQASKGKAHSESLLDAAIDKGRSTRETKEDRLRLIQPTTRYQDLAGCELVIEAVFEDRAVKADVTSRAEAQLSQAAVFASNTSTLPITSLAASSARPAQFVGLHFFSPVHKMELVEIIVGQQTSQETLARAFDFVRQLGKTPIVVQDARGFYTSRVFSTYVMEGAELLLEGQRPRSIEVAGLVAGMPVGPLALLDEVNLNLIARVQAQAQKDAEQAGAELPHQPGASVISRMLALNRPGKKEKQGFYDYPEGQPKRLWPELGKHFPPAPEPLAQGEMVERLLFVQANETARCFAEGVVRSVADANIGSILGWGFAPFHGGTLQFINACGLERFVARSRELAARYGARFLPADILVDMAATGGTFDA
ncbi:MAG TPA: 3-hydroxyacyl-CoA dehydrogenase NAD-binding domain-containing protein [Polyangia bacterium]|nr:3-hydroxyacyl-CoA dehydrogenase NAD-binding domain-containing protein [Polyangia bacterium]